MIAIGEMITGTANKKCHHIFNQVSSPAAYFDSKKDKSAWLQSDILLSHTKPIKMEIDAILREFKLKHFIADNEGLPVNDELTKWFLFMISGNGKSIKDLSLSNFREFQKEILELIELVYFWQQDQTLK